MWLSGGSNLRIKVEERIDAVPQLRFNLLPAAFEHVHGDARLFAVLQSHRRIVNLRNFICRKQTHSIHHHKICHPLIVSPSENVHLVPSRSAATHAFTLELVPMTSDLKSSSTTRDLVILGSGCSGLTAAIYAGRSNLNPLVLEGHEPGGQLSITTLVENFPGWPEGIQGPELIENMKKQAQRFGTELRMAHLTAADLSAHPIRLTIGAEVVHTRTLIIASGASARWLNLPSEQALIGHGVSSCATCDGFFASGKPIAVIGGGDSAMEEALFLTRFASKVTLINRTGKFRASPIMLERAQAHEKIEFLANTIVEEVLGVEEKDVKGLRIKNTVSDVESILPVSFMFLGIGHIPNAQAFRGMMDLDEDGYILTKNDVYCTLNGEVLPGVYACGDIQDRRYRQAITAAGSGCMAALEVEKYLEEHGR
jgi:thioredoxin reductase (NADPH)